MSSSGIEVRPLQSNDLSVAVALLADSPEAAHWSAEDLLAYRSLVAECDGRIVGIAVGRVVAPDESEVLNVAVDRGHRRRGIAEHLLGELLLFFSGTCFLEVRESNAAAQQLYKKMGFIEVGKRSRYYDNPQEDAIVMRLSPW